jgi:hypothetical protein
MSKLITTVASVCLFAMAVAAPSVVLAKAENAAVAERGQGCLVADANGNYTFDAACEYHVVTRNDRNGAVVLVSYHDQGNLPDGAPRPSSAVRRDVSSTVGGETCTGQEVTTPSGQYSSDCRFNARNN